MNLSATPRPMGAGFSLAKSIEKMAGQQGLTLPAPKPDFARIMYDTTSYFPEPAKKNRVKLPAPYKHHQTGQYEPATDNYILARHIGINFTQSELLTILQTWGTTTDYADDLYNNYLEAFAGGISYRFGGLGDWNKRQSFRAWLRIALQGAQPLTEDNAAEQLQAAVIPDAEGQKPPFETWKENFLEEATQWMEERAVGTWPVLPAILANLPIDFDVTRAVHTDFEDDAPAGLEYSLSLPLAQPIDARLLNYAYDGWREQNLQDNRVIAYALFLNSEPDLINDLVGEFGIRPELPMDEKTAALAETFASLATEQNRSYAFEAARQAEALGLDAHKTLTELRQIPLPAMGTGNLWKKITKAVKKMVQHPVKWLNSLRKEAGKLLVAVGKEVSRWGRVPILGDWFIAPLGIDFVFGEVLGQVGKVLVTGKASDFDEKQLGLGFARLLDRAGRALAIAAPFLPPPFNLAAAALAAISIAAGMGLAILLNAKDNAKAIDEYNAAQQAAFEAELEAAKLASEQEAAQQQAWAEYIQQQAEHSLMQELYYKGLLADAMYKAAQDGPREPDRKPANILLPIGLGIAGIGAVVGLAIVATRKPKPRKA